MNDTTTSEQAQARPGSGASAWVIVSQVKSNRVVYFTDDPDYQPPMEGDWYYCTPYAGALPSGMSLKNCWAWRFNGGVFAHAPATPKKTAAESLLESNRKALLGILSEKIDAVRKPYLPACKHGEVVRQVKLREAQTYLATSPAPGTGAQEGYPQLQAVAVARTISVLEAAQLVVTKNAEMQRMLLETERFREQLTQAIVAAKTQAVMLQLREWLLDKVYPELSREFRYGVENTEPIDPDKPLSDTHRCHEIARLKAQLREIVNMRREPIRSDYLHNDEIRKHKARIAQAVVLTGASKPEGADWGPLEAYAEARQLALMDAAKLILNSMAAAADLLARTEAVKDRMLPRIEAIKTLREVRSLSAEIDSLEKE